MVQGYKMGQKFVSDSQIYSNYNSNIIQQNAPSQPTMTSQYFFNRPGLKQTHGSGHSHAKSDVYQDTLHNKVIKTTSTSLNSGLR